MDSIKKRWCLFLLCIGMVVVTTGCVRIEGFEDATPQDDIAEQPVIKEQKQERKIHDKDTLYEKDDDASVVTMYLTVSSGNKSDNTNHTWAEINNYSVYDYEAKGVERYAVNGLLQVGDENGPVMGELGYGKYAPNATVAIRGQTSSAYPQKNYCITIKDGKGTWRNQKVINLNKHQQDITRFSNKMCYDLMKHLEDMISLRTQFVHLYVKDMTQGGNSVFTDYGLYTQVEQLNRRALQSHGLDKNGQLYKINFMEFRTYEGIIKRKNEAGYDEAAFEELLEIKGDDDHSKLVAMLKDVNDYSLSIDTVVDKWFEKDNILSWLAFQILIGNTDTQSRNTFLYSPLNENTFYFISWDCDAAFIDTKRRYQEMEAEIGWEKGVSNYWGNVLFQRMLKSDKLRDALDEKIKAYRCILTEDLLQEKARQYAEVVEQYAYVYPDLEYMPITRPQYEEMLTYLPSEVEQNYQLYKESLASPMPFFIMVPEKVENGLKCKWGTSYDLHEETITYTFELAGDYSFVNPLVKQDKLFIPEYQYEGELAPGQYFIRIKATNESGYEQYAFDYYVTADSVKKYGILCFYVLEDGTIVEDTYEE